MILSYSPSGSPHISGLDNPSNISSKNKFFSNIELMFVHKHVYSDNQQPLTLQGNFFQMNEHKVNACNIYWSFWNYMSRKLENKGHTWDECSKMLPLVTLE